MDNYDVCHLKIGNNHCVMFSFKEEISKLPAKDWPKYYFQMDEDEITTKWMLDYVGSGGKAEEGFKVFFVKDVGNKWKCNPG